MKNIVVIGAGDLGKEVVWLIEDINKAKPTYLILGFLDDDWTKDTEFFYGYQVLGNTDKLEELNKKYHCSAVIAIRDGKIRQSIVSSHSKFDRWETIVHPTSVIASSVIIGKGCIFFPHVTVSVDTCLGLSNLLYIHSTICNDCNLGDYVSVMANAVVPEHAEIEDFTFVDSNKSLEPHSYFMGR
jgi:hypothetical protein